MSESKAALLTQLIDDLERAVFQRRTAEGVTLLLRLLKELGAFTGPQGIMPPPGTAGQRRAAYTRIAAMISALICSPDFTINLTQIGELCGAKPVLETVFELSGYEGPFHLLQYHGRRNEQGGVSLRSNQILVLALFYSLDDIPAPLMEGVLRLPADHLLPLVLGWMATPFVHSEAGEANRRRLIDGAALIESATPTNDIIQAICSAWMHCSYADHPNKHAFKHSLNAVWRRIATMASLKSPAVVRQKKDQPVLLVAAERMSNGHAMHRSYAACLRQLRPRFRVVCMAAEGYISADTHELFDEVMVLERSISFRDIGARLARLAPDLIYYPSLGMSEWTQAVANLRFAPIQVMTLGHPAPAMMDTMDYSLVQAGHGEAAWEFGRKVIERRAWGQFQPHDALQTLQIDAQAHDDGRLHVAVNSSLMKLSPRFLGLIERLEAEAKRPLHFHFFASANGVAHDRLHQIFKRRFRYFTLEPSRQYGDFLNTLAGCDLALAAFPFGNTNSTVDTCLLGIPTVAYVANEVLSIGDRDVMRLVGLPDWLVSDNDEAYFQTAMKLIHEDAARQAIVEQLKATDVKAKLFQPPRPEDATEFVDALWWIYQNHEALQASSKNLLQVGEPIPA